MSLLRNLILGVLAVSLLTFVALFGQLPALRKTPIGWLQRALCIYIPTGLRDIDATLTGGTVTRHSVFLSDYLFHQNNPVVLIFYLSILTGSAALFLGSTIDRLPSDLLWPLWIILPAPYVFTYLCVSHKAHYIDATNHNARMADYPYDHILYRPRTTCWTCQRVKPPRSKHCGLCGICVAKCDHHCPWVYNCVGQGNYRYFLAMLISLNVLQVYGAYLSWWILRPHFSFGTAHSFFSREFLADIGSAIVIAIDKGGISVAGVGFLAAATAALPFGLFAYHCYLIWAGMTTNESQKWSDWKDDMVDGLVYRARRKKLDAHNQSRLLNSQIGGDNPALSVSTASADRVPWPLKSVDVLVRTRDGNPPHGQEDLWTQVRDLDDIINIYDLGASRNMLDTIYGR